eukprot:jgi/Chrzof1/12527/Cz06g37130.t1
MRGCKLDPVQLYVNYIAAHPAPADAPAFLFDRNGSLEPLSFELLTAGIKKSAALAGMDAARYASHSLRKGGARAALAAGLNEHYTMFQGDWASNCFQRCYSMSPACVGFCRVGNPAFFPLIGMCWYVGNAMLVAVVFAVLAVPELCRQPLQ